ncbi:hypothetical protein TIFTF001_054113 [Ficus carica]|uniref:Cytochrome P450 n=1 Tax=Ficus carica TaxID=3494 RepID=A0AA88JF18_FICCA|nr:hypothetical protein TIFTF001_054110 [Ficus carica]GMN71516.1 hypothetical protein TIFTF001_054111 [Ficus carica]GMN71522.1 hypothetical protein TIFTF001_054112 [Ficus carica]GMN71525.1 hypothetical protein TIFTF001_054113 [Ficus carica]
MSELMKHPSILKKVQKELETVVGMSRLVEESDLKRLDYLDMVVKETMRLHPVAPLLIPHAALEDCTVNGFHIPQKSRVFINIWAIGRDPNSWTDPEKFFPERFEGSSVDLRGRDFQLIPFGAGRRGCPGMQLGLIVVKLVLAQLVHCFDWELPNGLLPTEDSIKLCDGNVLCTAAGPYSGATRKRALHNSKREVVQPGERISLFAVDNDRDEPRGRDERRAIAKGRSHSSSTMAETMGRSFQQKSREEVQRYWYWGRAVRSSTASSGFATR